MAARRLDTLDAMRGVAAVAVVAFHLDPLITPLRVRHGYLAVDFFFGLSGLVLATAYRRRFEAGLGVAEFIKMRVVRFYPLYALGTLLGLVATLWPIIRGYWPWPGAVSFVATVLTAALLLPGPALGAESGDDLMPLDPPAWSLLFELGANLLLVACWRFLSARVLALVLAVSAALLVAQCLAQGTMNMGAVRATALLGIDRTVFSFTAGLCLARVLPRMRRVRGILVYLPLAVLFATFLPGAAVGPVYDLLCVLLVFPALLLWGASVEPAGRSPFRFLGAISFALYAIHFPLIFGLRLLVYHLPGGKAGAAPWVGVLAIPIFTAFAWLADHHYDRPVRGWLGRRFGTRRSAAL